MRAVARRFLFLSAFLWFVALVSPMVTPASAEISGNCGATFKGVDVAGVSSSSAGDAIDVDDNEVVTVNFTSPTGFTSHHINLEIAGVSRSVASGEDGGDTTWSETVNVKDYAWAGAGLYKVSGTATLTDGSTCSGAALINVTRNPLTTVAGGVAAATTAVGVGAVVASGANSVMQGSSTSGKIDHWSSNWEFTNVEEQKKPEGTSGPISEEQAWIETVDLFFGPFIPGWRIPFCLLAAVPALVLTGAAMATPGGGPPASSSGFKLRRASWLPRITVVGVFGGLLGGLGAAVLLQQYGVRPLTLSQLITGLVVGLIVGIVIPSLGHLWAVMRVNRSVESAETKIKQALAAQQGGGTPPAEPQS